MTITITQEAVDAAAKRLFESVPQGEPRTEWDELKAVGQLEYKEHVLPILIAGGPHLVAGALNELAADTRARGDIGKEDGLEPWDYLGWQAGKALEAY